MNRRRWIALFSQTGSELKSIVNALNIQPDIVMTNNLDIDVLTIPGITSVQGKHEDLMARLEDGIRPGDLITLHGYLRIIPRNIVESEADIYNGHPGLITEYPELRGKDPQHRLFLNQDKYDKFGCVIHRVSPDVDAGEICAYTCFPMLKHPVTEEYITEVLHNMSTRLWIDFLVEELITV